MSTLVYFKTCIDCSQALPLDAFYRNPVAGDRLDQKCKTCRKAYQQERYRLKKQDPAFLERERVRAREKYHRLGYLTKHGHGSVDGRQKWRELFPEKVQAYSLSQHILCPEGYQRHHWSYREEHAKDVILLPQEDHYRLHQYIVYDQSEKLYRTREGVLLRTREEHEAYAQSVLSSPS